MNERGLWFDAFSAPPMKAAAGSDLPRFSGNIVDRAMAECSTVEEVVRLFSQYNRDFLVEAIYMFADASGDAVSIERNAIVRKSRRHFVQTNFHQSRSNGSEDGRFTTASEMLERAGRRHLGRPLSPHPRRHSSEGQCADALLQHLRPACAHHAPLLLPRFRQGRDVQSRRRVEERRARAGHPGAVPTKRRGRDVRGAPKGRDSGPGPGRGRRAIRAPGNPHPRCFVRRDPRRSTNSPGIVSGGWHDRDGRRHGCGSFSSRNETRPGNGWSSLSDLRRGDPPRSVPIRCGPTA